MVDSIPKKATGDMPVTYTIEFLSFLMLTHLPRLVLIARISVCNRLVRLMIVLR